ncbi:MAG: methanogenesis marker 2 protein [Candidatus Schekmanbacteria bacterium]|nr:MAG: methanogenesis marker 2 protein [Candidatus Schekmanbacteria bacterium]
MIDKIIAEVKKFDGILRKKDIKIVGEILKDSFLSENVVIGIGDDAGVIRGEKGEDFLLLACDGIHPLLVKNEPYAAGKASVMVNVNDIYAMGGVPVGIVNVISYNREENLKAILEGMRKASVKYRVPILGGHLHPDAECDEISVAILGKGEKILSSYGANSGDDVIIAVDLKGKKGCKSVNSWDSTSGKDSKLLLTQLSVLNKIANEQLASACKDVSMGGIIGTLGMLLESSKKGAEIDLNLIPCPQDMELLEWLKCFLSYGFLLTSPPQKTKIILNLFKERDIESTAIGRVNESRKVDISYNGEKGTLFDFKKDYIACL